MQSLGRLRPAPRERRGLLPQWGRLGSGPEQTLALAELQGGVGDPATQEPALSSYPGPRGSGESPKSRESVACGANSVCLNDWEGGRGTRCCPTEQGDSQPLRPRTRTCGLPAAPVAHRSAHPPPTNPLKALLKFASTSLLILMLTKCPSSPG